MKWHLTVLLLPLFFSCSKEETPVQTQPGSTYVTRILLTAPLIRDDYYFTYNSNNRITGIEQKDYRTIRLSYNTSGLLTKMTSDYHTGKPQGHTDYFYNGDQLVKEIRTHIEEDPFGNSSSYTQTILYEYTNGQLSIIKTLNNSGILKASATIIYNSAGDPQTITSTTGIRYEYSYADKPHQFLPGNERIYNCLEDLLPFTFYLSHSTPADLNYYIPFKKQVTGITQYNSTGLVTMQLRFDYTQDATGKTQQLEVTNLKGGNTSHYAFTYGQ
ncbi:hypothetical protein [Sediminibacterium ginsengisoli]|uniref:YD repeat-containing protein n=1 Tax=Sediminibacterium ginsengisoli TaxID=413434 RepID=A0A1T4PNH6_9BACT|nr:hypothetical protein [Sediminibacterium ginsengisoli]SJZ92881.1 YD repeat-containing protein [Sediminibacterium ginsengisoli]